MQPADKGNTQRKTRSQDAPQGDTPEDENEPSQAPAKERPTLSQYKVRTSATDRTLDAMFPVTAPSRTQSRDEAGTSASQTKKESTIQESVCYLASVRGLRKNVLERKHIRRSISSKISLQNLRL